MIQTTEPEFPAHVSSVGTKIEFLSRVLLPNGKFDDYVRLMSKLLDERVHYIDPVHEFHSRDDVLKMLAKVVPRTCNNQFHFELLSETQDQLIWRWTIQLKIRWTPFRFTIHGLVHARLSNGNIIYQREYYDPMESIEVIPIVGKLYKLVLRLG